ncbi:kinetochore protein Nuf2-like [Zootermopsis nevadensis]|uniref:Kinetochore protein Nuf2 n=1 Tax=Zootermopsis nevadensis TaxID=136037 RepID=A0A067QHB3_ZOONE|nr:kinetochore protein Nuf2-like [Zootermopsis nevadensis]XP_021940359.1 kinetochore protein Nuf2-like [Zootermopsis nevadensis]XP_021940360.1 kinetochore protein Nuf2-like [Zootermopsis nevadensis]XP_021940361.1 kinetochore protein Nuf2-like [Zootermopsis nevadensis]KDR07720.1 Kinetochore protein Nuf2 [Zootermopsis nevadensis]
MLSQEDVVTSTKDKMPYFPICMSDMKAPTAKFIQSYYFRVLEVFGVDVDNLKEPSPEQVQELDYSDAYRPPLPLLNLYFALSYIYKHIFVDNFSIMDITEPTPQRTLYLMNAMDAFHTFADWKAQNVENISAELLQRKAECDELRAQCEELKKELNMTASERAQREMRKKELFAADEETRNEILQLKKEDAEIQEDMALSEAAFVKAEQKNEMLQAEYQKLGAEVSELRNQIVEFPDQLVADLNRLRELKEKVEAEKQHLAEVKQEKDRQKELYEKFVRMGEECEVKLKDILATDERINKLDKNQERSQKKKEASTTKEQEMNKKIQNSLKKIARLQEQKMAVGLQWENRKTALAQNIEEKTREKMLLKNKLRDALDKVADISAKREELDETFNLLERQNEEQNKAFDDLYEKKTSEQDASIKKIQDAQTQLLKNLRRRI